MGDHGSPGGLPALDGGWGWACVAGCFMMYIMRGGLNFAVIYVHVVEQLESSATIGSSVVGLNQSVNLMLGPLVSILVRRFSYRSVTAVGALIFAGGWILCAFTKSTWITLFGFSLLGGTGAALVYFPSIIILSEYFDKRIGIAIGIATAGYGIGSLALPPILELLFSEYGYRGAMVIIGAIGLNHLVSAAIYCSPAIAASKTFPKPPTPSNTGSDPSPTVDINELNDHHPLSIFSLKSYDSVNYTPLNGSDSSDTSFEDILTHVNKQNDLNVKAECELPNGHVQNGYSRSNLKDSLIEEVMEKEKESGNTLCCFIAGVICRHRLFTISFISFVLSASMMLASINSGLNLMVDHALDNSVPSSLVVYLLSFLGVADLFGSVVFGFVYDIECIRPLRCYIYVLLLFLLGGTAIGYAYSRTYPCFVLTSTLFGLCTGSLFTGVPVFLKDLVEPEDHALAFGLTLFFQGIGSIIGPPIGGFLKDITGTYEASYLFMGFASILAGLMFFCGFQAQKLTK